VLPRYRSPRAPPRLALPARAAAPSPEVNDAAHVGAGRAKQAPDGLVGDARRLNVAANAASAWATRRAGVTAHRSPWAWPLAARAGVGDTGRGAAAYLRRCADRSRKSLPIHGNTPIYRGASRPIHGNTEIGRGASPPTCYNPPPGPATQLIATSGRRRDSYLLRETHDSHQGFPRLHRSGSCIESCIGFLFATGTVGVRKWRTSCSVARAFCSEVREQGSREVLQRGGTKPGAHASATSHERLTSTYASLPSDPRGGPEFEGSENGQAAFFLLLREFCLGQ
jgi:hypothetical protein